MDYPAIAEAEMLNQEVYTAGDAKQVNDARKKAARARKEELDYIRHIMSTPQGRKWICSIIALGDPLVSPYAPGNTPEHTHVNLGKQAIPQKLMMDIREGDPEQYVLMLKEAMEANKR